MPKVTGFSINSLIPRLLEEIGKVFAEVKQEEVETFADLIHRATKVFVHGAGRVGIASRALAMRLTHLGKTSYWVNDDTTPSIRPGDLLVVNSGSGGSNSSLNIAAQAKRVGGQIATVTANPLGEIAQMSDAVLLLPAQTFNTDRSAWTSILPMGSQFELCLWIIQDMLSLMLMEKMVVEESMMIQRHRNLE